jgi:hypothetical protein
VLLQVAVSSHAIPDSAQISAQVNRIFPICFFSFPIENKRFKILKVNTGSICYNNAVCNTDSNSSCSSIYDTCEQGSFVYNSGKIKTPSASLCLQSIKCVLYAQVLARVLLDRSLLETLAMVIKI